MKELALFAFQQLVSSFTMAVALNRHPGVWTTRRVIIEYIEDGEELQRLTGDDAPESLDTWIAVLKKRVA